MKAHQELITTRHIQTPFGWGIIVYFCLAIIPTMLAGASDFNHQCQCSHHHQQILSHHLSSQSASACCSGMSGMHSCHMEKGAEHSAPPIDLPLHNNEWQRPGISLTADILHESHAFELGGLFPTNSHLPQQAPVPIYLQHLSFRC